MQERYVRAPVPTSLCPLIPSLGTTSVSLSQARDSVGLHMTSRGSVWFLGSGASTYVTDWVLQAFPARAMSFRTTCYSPRSLFLIGTSLDKRVSLPL